MDYTLEKKLQGFQLIAQEKLQTILWSIPHKKDLIIEPSVIKTLEHVCGASWIKSKGVQSIFKFDPEVAIQPRMGNTQVFLISSNQSTFKKVLNQIQEHERKQPFDTESGLHNFHIILVPNCNICFQNMLEEDGLHSIVQLHRFNWDFIFIDSSVISLELPQAFNEIFVRHDISLLPPMAHSLRILKMLVGKPDLILIFGKYSRKILQMINLLEKNSQSKNNSLSSQTGDFSAMIIIDRDKDYISSLLTPAIYSGLLLEVFKYRAGEVEITPNETKISSQKLKIFQIHSNKSKSKKTNDDGWSTIRLNSKKDIIYGENRYKHFLDASNLVRTQAKAIGDEVEKLNKMNVNEMQQFVQITLPQITEKKSKILKHMNVCEKIVEELSANIQKLFSLEEDILNNTNRKKILTEIDNNLVIDGQKYNTIRLMCLVNLSMGLNTQELSNFIRNYCNYFGHQYLHVFYYLAKAGLLPYLEETKVGKSKLLANLTLPKFQQTEFQANANRLKLLVSSAGNDSQSNKTDSSSVCPSYVFNGIYIPLIAQLACTLLNVRNFEELFQKLGAIDNIDLQTSDMSGPHLLKQILSVVNRGEIRNIFPIKKRTIFVFVVGGVTYAEIAACEFIGRLTSSQIVVGSNTIIAGSDIVAAGF